MTLEEMNRKWEAAHAAPASAKAEDDDLEFLEEEDDEEDEEEDDEPGVEASLNNACDILHEVMEVMGRLGQLRNHIGKEEKHEMLGYAQQIYAFLDEIGEIDGEDKE